MNNEILETVKILDDKINKIDDRVKVLETEPKSKNIISIALDFLNIKK